MHDIMAQPEEAFAYTPEEKFFKLLFETFNGERREWCGYKNGNFFHRLMPSSWKELCNYFKNTCAQELHFTVEEFSGNTDNRTYWMFVIDIDEKIELLCPKCKALLSTNKKCRVCNAIVENPTLIHPITTKAVACERVTRMLDNFGVFYLVDSRHHIFVPQWCYELIDEWNSYYGMRSFYISLKTYIESISKITRLGFKIDEQLWYVHRHPIRVPYTLHSKSGTSQYFFGYTLEDFANTWTGRSLSSDSMFRYMQCFKFFIETARRLGDEIYNANHPHEMQENDERPAGWKYAEKLLNISVPVGLRGTILWKVIMPYLVNVKKLSREEVLSAAVKWIDQSHGEKPRDIDLYTYPRKQFSYFCRTGVKPYGQRRFAEEFPQVAEVLKS